MSLIWNFSDQQSIKPISANKQGIFNQLATEVQFVKLKEIMGADFYQDVVRNPSATYNAELIAGGTYTIGDFTYEFKGLKYVLSYLFYEAYILQGHIQDTFIGMVSSTNEDARALSWGEKKNLAQEMRRIALKHWEDCWSYVCETSENFPYAAMKSSGRITFI